MTPLARFHRFTVIVLLATLAVIVWGGYVRATGSGAGCGSHWPLCNGEVLPRSPGLATLVELTHRLTSGVAFLLVVVQLAWAVRRFPRRHEVRRAAFAVFVLMVVEALVGAGLVIFEMVAGNTSTARAFWMAAHLLNTFALLAAMALTTHRAARAAAPERKPVAGPDLVGVRRALAGAIAVMVVIAVSGAVVALGDTLFPSRSLSEGFAQDVAPTAHLFIRLRVYHPVLAVLGGLYVLVVAALLAGKEPALRAGGLRVAMLVLLQLGIGLVNLLLLAPVALQLVHLLMADLLWLALVSVWFDVAHATRVAPVAAAPATALPIAGG